MDRLQLHVERVAHLAVRVGGIADAVELQVCVTQASLCGRLRELLRLRKLDPVGRRLHRLIAHLAGIRHRVQEVRRKRRLAARELHRHLAPRLDRDRVVQHGLDVVPRQLVNEAHLVRIHEARIAHHVAAVRQIDGQHRPAPVRHRGRAMVVQLLIVVRADVAPWKDFFQMLEELGVHRHHVFKVPVLGAILHHQDLAVALDDLRLDLADLLVQQNLVRQFAVNDLLTNLRHALRAQRIGRPRPAKRRLFLLVALQKRLVGPLGRKRSVRLDAVQLLKDGPRTLGGHRDCPFCVFNGFRHLDLLCMSPQAPIGHRSHFGTGGSSLINDDATAAVPLKNPAKCQAVLFQHQATWLVTNQEHRCAELRKTALKRQKRVPDGAGNLS